MSEMVRLQVNGEATEVAAGVTVAQLLERMDLLGKRVAVEVNQEIVPRGEHGERALCAGDVVEIVQAIGGG